MLFKDIIGQQSIIDTLLRLAQTNRLPHAILFYGEHGWGPLPMALALAQYLMCEQPGQTDACGICNACTQVTKLSHPDLHLSFPSIAVTDNKENVSSFFLPQFREFVSNNPYGSVNDWIHQLGEAKQGNLSAEEARRIVDNMTLKAYLGGKKIQIIWMPEYLKKEGNRLLKLIEEPPADTVLILVAVSKEDILPTILSRVQHFRFKPLSVVEIQNALIKMHGLDETTAGQLALVAEGDFTKALFLKDNWNNDMLPLISHWLNALYANNGKEIIDWVDKQASSSRDELKSLAQYIQQLFASGLRYSISPDTANNLAPADKDFVKKIAALKLSQDSLTQIHHELDNFIFEMGRNVHIKTALLSLSIRMQYLIKNRKFIPAFSEIPT